MLVDDPIAPGWLRRSLCDRLETSSTRAGTSSGATLPKPTRPSSVSTSTSGSSQSMPRDPLRTTGMPGRLEGGCHLVGADRDRSGITGNEHPYGRSRQRHPSVSASSRSADSRPWSRPSRVPDGPSAQLPRQKTSETSTPAPEAVGPLARVGVQRLGADRLAGLAAAQRDRVRRRRQGAEVVVEGHDPVHLGHREVQHVGDRLDVLTGDVPELARHVVQDRQQRAALAQVLRRDGAHERDPVGRGRSGHAGAPEVPGVVAVTIVMRHAHRTRVNPRRGPGAT